MADLFSNNLDLTIMRHEHARMIAQVNIQAKSIRIIELQEEIVRCNNDMEAQKKVIEEAERNIKIHQEAKNSKEKEQLNG
jgi:arginine deiminase